MFFEKKKAKDRIILENFYYLVRLYYTGDCTKRNCIKRKPPVISFAKILIGVNPNRSFISSDGHAIKQYPVSVNLHFFIRPVLKKNALKCEKVVFMSNDAPKAGNSQLDSK